MRSYQTIFNCHKIGVVEIDIKRIEDLQYHYISNEGKIYSDYSGELKEISQYVDNKGKYKLITISEKGTRYKYLVHRLVAKAFLPNPNNLPEVNHKDYNTKNNNVDNLEWCTTQENISHMLKHSSPVRNFRECSLIKNGLLITTCKSINEACRVAHELFQASYSSLQKYKKFKDIEIVCH